MQTLSGYRELTKNKCSLCHKDFSENEDPLSQKRITYKKIIHVMIKNHHILSMLEHVSFAIVKSSYILWFLLIIINIIFTNVISTFQIIDFN